jgi:hypothetical protein
MECSKWNWIDCKQIIELEESKMHSLQFFYLLVQNSPLFVEEGISSADRIDFYVEY